MRARSRLVKWHMGAALGFPSIVLAALPAVLFSRPGGPRALGADRRQGSERCCAGGTCAGQLPPRPAQTGPNQGFSACFGPAATPSAWP